MTWNGGPGRIVFWRGLAVSPTLAADQWIGPTGFQDLRADLPDQGKGTYSAGTLPITGMGMVDIIFHPTFAGATSDRCLARVLLNGVVIARSGVTAADATTVDVSTPAFLKPGDVLNFEVWSGLGGRSLDVLPGSSYISVLSR